MTWLRVVAAMVATLCGLAHAGSVRADDGPESLPRAKVGTRFQFEVIESVDAAYLGDTPGHMGRGGDLAVRPNVALGDGVYRTVGETTSRIGTITRIRWERVSGGLTVEFDPVPLVRVAVGEVVWIDLNPAPPAAASPPPLGP